MIDLVVLLSILAAAAAAGLLALRFTDALPRDRHEHLLAGVATGLGLASMLGLGLAALSTALRPADTNEVRAGNVPNMVAMSKARHPAWVVFLGPFIGALGVVIGGKLKRRA